MEKNKKYNFNYSGLHILIDGAVFIWLYRAIGIQQVVSFPALFLLVGIETVFFLASLLIAVIIAFLAYKSATQQVQEIFKKPRFDEDGYEYYEE